MSESKRILVTGAGGFIGGHLVRRLLDEGNIVTAVDVKRHSDWWQGFYGEGNHNCRVLDDIDLRDPANARLIVRLADAEEVYNLAADMGGMGFIEGNNVLCMRNWMINANLLEAAVPAGVYKYFFSSTACVYRADTQDEVGVRPLRENRDVYPAMPEEGYGWEKLMGEHMCRYVMEEQGLRVRVARYFTMYGPQGSYKGGREKAPAAICRKVAMAVLSGDHRIEVWGDGHQERNFTYIDDCIEGTMRLMDSDCAYPTNIGRQESVTINQLVDLVEECSGLGAGTLERVYDTSKPQGVRSRNSDNKLIYQRLGWTPQVELLEGLQKTYDWVLKQVKFDLGVHGDGV